MFATVSGLITKGRDRNAAVHRPQKWLCSAGLFGVKQGVAAAHAEVRKQHTPIIKVDQEVFGTPTDVLIRVAEADDAVSTERDLSAVDAMRQDLEGEFEIRRVEIVGPQVSQNLFPNLGQVLHGAIAFHGGPGL